MHRRWDILLVVAAGGSLGAGARWAIAEALPRSAGSLPWATFLVNVTGCFALGALMVFVIDVVQSSRHLRPFVGVGLLGGYTTFSTYALEARDLLVAHHQAVAASYLAGSVAAGLLAVWLGVVTARLLLLARPISLTQRSAR